MLDPNGILMIEPQGHISEKPVVDELTRKMTAAWRARRDSNYGYKGFHACVCGACSDNKDHWVGEGEGLLTNSLAIHYLAFHRPDISPEELAKVSALTYGEEDPSEEELNNPLH